MQKHFSVSQLNMFYRCGIQYEYRYLKGEKIPPALPMLLGTGVHKAAEVNFTEKMKTFKDEPLSVLQDAAAEAVEQGAEDGYFVAPDDLASAEIDFNATKDKSVALVKPLREQLTPTIQPELVEAKLEIEVDGLPPILGYLDFYGKVIQGGEITNIIKLSDIKTSTKKRSQAQLDSEPQAAIYKKAVEAHGWKAPDVIAYDQLIWSSKGPRYEEGTTTRNEYDFIDLIRKFRAMKASIDAGIFIPAEAGSWVCSPKFCGWFHVCKYTQGARSRIINIGKGE